MGTVTIMYSCCLVGKAGWSCSKWKRRGATPTQCRIEQITFIDEQRHGNKLKINYELSSLGRFPYFLGAGRKLLSPGERFNIVLFDDILQSLQWVENAIVLYLKSMEVSMYRLSTLLAH